MKRIMLIIAVLLIGAGLLSYPYVSNYLAQQDGANAIQEFQTGLHGESDGEIEAQRALAQAYNESITGMGLGDPFLTETGYALPANYNEILDFANHMMGTVEIPKIDVNLPIYHGVDDETLAKGVGHMSQTAFPIGGAGSHAVLTGHSALPSAKLFTDLPELAVGDTFYIHILNETLAYEVDQINIVLPDETEYMIPTPGEDYVTLITCTPYAVNTHRLLVRGTRVPYVEQQYIQEVKSGGLMFSGIDKQAMTRGLFIAAPVLLIVVVAAAITRRARGNRAGTDRRRERSVKP